MKHYLLGLVFCTLVTGACGAGNRTVIQKQNKALQAEIDRMDVRINELRKTTFTEGTVPVVNDIKTQTKRIGTATGTNAVGADAGIGNLKLKAGDINTALQNIAQQMASLTALSDSQKVAFTYMNEYLNSMADARSQYNLNAIALIAHNEIVNDPAKLTLKTAEIKALPKVTSTNGSDTRKNPAQERADNATANPATATTALGTLETDIKASTNFTALGTDWFDAGKPLNATPGFTNLQALAYLSSIKQDYDNRLTTLGATADASDNAISGSLDAAINAYKALGANDAARPSQILDFTTDSYDPYGAKVEALGTSLATPTVTANYNDYWMAVTSVRASYELALQIYLDRLQEAMKWEADSKTCTGIDGTGFKPNDTLLLHLNALVCDAVTDLIRFDLESIDQLMIDYANNQGVVDYTANPMPADCVLAAFKNTTDAGQDNWTFWSREPDGTVALGTPSVKPADFWMSRADTDGFKAMLDQLDAAATTNPYTPFVDSYPYP